MKRRILIDFSLGVSLLFFSIIGLIFSHNNFFSINVITHGIFFIYLFFNLVSFCLVDKCKNFEKLLSLIITILCIVLISLLDAFNTPENLSIAIFIWIVSLGLIKLKKIEKYYKNEKNIWIQNIIFLIFFILIGLISVINLYYETENQILILSYFGFVNGLLELSLPLNGYLLLTKVSD